MTSKKFNCAFQYLFHGYGDGYNKPVCCCAVLRNAREEGSHDPCNYDLCPLQILSSKQTKKIIPFRKQGKTSVNKMCDEFKKVQTPK